MTVKVKKADIIKGFKIISKYITLGAEAQAEVDYIIGEYDTNPRNATIEEVKNVVASIEVDQKQNFNQVVSIAVDIAKAKKSEEESKVIPLVELPPVVKIKENSTKEEVPPVVVKKPNKKEEPKVTVQGAPILEVAPKETGSKTKKEKGTIASYPSKLILEQFTKDNKTLKARPDLKDIKAVAEAWQNDTDLVIATYWTKTLLKQYAGSYDPYHINPNKPKAFEQDLDIVDITMACDLVVTASSIYTMVPTVFLPEDFIADEDSQMRFTNGVEFEVYEVVDKK